MGTGAGQRTSIGLESAQRAARSWLTFLGVSRKCGHKLFVRHIFGFLRNLRATLTRQFPTQNPHRGALDAVLSETGTAPN